MQNLACKLNIPLGPGVRDLSLEADLQSRIDDGHKVYAIGDVHGHLATFRALLYRLKLGKQDRVICLGDMIDRGPDSAGVVKLIRSDKRIICLKGNHEHMAIQSITKQNTVELWQPWMKRGGKSCWGSYIVQAEGDLYRAKRNFLSDMKWLDALPTQIVLDQFRLVHAGYDPRMPLDSQGDKELLWIRKTWYNFDQPVDPDRCVIFGHTPTVKLGASKGGDLAKSSFSLSDGRPGWIAMDTGAYNHVNPCLAALDLARLTTVKQATLRTDKWFDIKSKPAKYLKKIRQRAKKWRLPENRKESHIADSFGLKVLQERSRNDILAESKARKEINKISQLIPAIQGYRQAEMRRPFTWRRIAKRAKSNSYPLITRHQWQHESRIIRLGPGTENNRSRPHLPGPHSFTFYHCQNRSYPLMMQNHVQNKSTRKRAK